MKQNIIERYFPLKNYFGEKQSLRSALLVKRLDLLPVGTYVRKHAQSDTIGKTRNKVEPMENAEDLLHCDLIKIKGELLDPSLETWGHFSLLDVIPLLDEEIQDLEKELKTAGY